MASRFEGRAVAVVAGHFGFAALVKARERSTPLWALMLACQWLDVVFIPLFATHVETLVPVEGTHGGYGEAIIYADYTHSLLGAFALSAVFGGAGVWLWNRRVGAVLGAVVFSHWVLDLLVHRADLPLLPGNAGDLPRLGFGLWRAPSVSLLVEFTLVAAGAYAYWKAASEVSVAAGQSTRRANLTGALVLMFGLMTLTLGAFGL